MEKNGMITFDEAQLMLDDIANELPEDFYKELNGGIILLPDTKTHPRESGMGSLFILGEYHNDRKGYGGLGRYITIYYGSFINTHPNLPPDRQREKLREILIHEFTHHLESLAGERGLEIKDAQELERYNRGKK